MFTLTTAPFRALEQSFLSDFKAVKEGHPFDEVLVVSPSGHILTRLQELVAAQNPSGAILNVHFLTFYGLAEQLMADSAYTERVVTEPEVYREFIREILVGESPERVDLEIRRQFGLSGNALPLGLAGALAETLKDLRDAGLRIDSGLEAAREGLLGQGGEDAAATLALYARLVGLFEKHGLRSSADLLRRAAGLAPTNPWIKSLKAIFLYGFYDLTGVQLDLVRSLSDHPHARIYFPYENENPAYAFAEKLLKDPALSTKVDGGTGRQGKKAASPSLPVSPSPRLEVWTCSGPRDEVWLTAKEILKLSDEGIPLREIAVVSRNVAGYVPSLHEIFAANAIPYYSSRSAPAGSHPLIKTIETLLTFDDRSPTAGVGRRHLEKSPYITPSAIPSEMPLEEDGWKSHLTRAQALLKNAIALPQNATPEETALLATATASLEELMMLDLPERKVSRRHFLEVVKKKLDVLELPAPGRAHDGIQVLDVQEARGLPFRIIFLLGMNEKVFPRLIREDPFLSDAARSALAQATGARLGRKMDGYEEERLLLELMRSAASERLYLLAQRSDSEGKALIPSVYLKEMERQNPSLEPLRLSRGLAEKFEKLLPLLWTPKELSFFMNRAELDPKPIYQALHWDLAGYTQALSTHKALENLRSGQERHDGRIEDVSLLAKILSKPLSPTGLEDLAECPYQFFAKNVLSLKPVEEVVPQGELTPKILGQLIHRTLELFYGKFFDGQKELTTALDESIRLCFEEYKEELAPIYPLIIESSKLIVINELIQFIKSDIEESKASGYRPKWFEQALEGPLPLPQLPYRFYGKVDRLDISEEAGQTRIRVVDYKSGRPRPLSGRIETQLIQGKFLQLPVYLGLAAAFASEKLGKPVTAESATLRPIKQTDDESAEKTLDHSFWASPSAILFQENIQELVKIIQNGRFFIEPSVGDRGYCARCDYALICRKEHMPTRLRAERDPARQHMRDKLSRTAPKASDAH